jgi:D-glycero-D-manno-heptose 1,7-bisphosphate phosphatase
MIIIDPPAAGSTRTHSRTALFLDRDGIVNTDTGYVHRIEDFRFVEGIFPLCRAAVAQDLLLIVVTNQSGIARGHYSAADFAALSQWMMRRFAEEGTPLTRVIGCPHHPDFPAARSTVPCICRKPAPGMLLKAMEDFQIDPAVSIILGDRATDLEAGRRSGVGMRLLLRRPDGAPEDTHDATHVVDSLAEAEALIAARGGAR